MTDEKYLGVDGCKAGWFFVAIGPGDESEFGIFENIELLFHAYSGARWILIDIPIGLPSEAKESRSCDREARIALKPVRHNSVFSPPCRKALSAKTFAEACRINQKVMGRKISLQAYHISKKIREVDDLLNRRLEARRIIRETHPEICFWAFAGFRPLMHRKKDSKGVEERLDLLKQSFPGSSSIYKAALDRYPRKQVARDDILDALAAAVTASHLDNHGIALSKYPEKDTLGLPMEIVYALPKDIPVSDNSAQEEDLPATIPNLIHLAGSEQRVFPATEYYNETWMLRIVLDWFSSHHVKGHPLSFTKDCRWFSEGLIPSQFLPRSRKDPLGESWTHADAVVGHFEVGEGGKADIQLASNATHLTCVEAKMFSRLSSGVKNAPYFNQAARYIACMAELMHRAEIKPGEMKRLAFLILAPEEQIDAGVFSTQSSPDHIDETVKHRASEYEGEKDRWYMKCFLPIMEKVDIQSLSWESIIETISKSDSYCGNQFKSFYLKCLEYNRPAK